ncbi:MAG: hypothetical protein V3U84_00275 [Thiotrichaceae bacterium]
MPVGRPPQFTTEYAEELAEAIPLMFKNGESVAEVCATLGMSKDRFYHMVEISPVFSDSYDRGKDLAEAWWTKLGRGGAAGEVKINSAVYNFSMKNKFKWVDRVETTGAVEVIGKTEFTRVAMPPPSNAKTTED